jgi:hypothetical protein
MYKPLDPHQVQLWLRLASLLSLPEVDIRIVLTKLMAHNVPQPHGQPAKVINHLIQRDLGAMVAAYNPGLVTVLVVYVVHVDIVWV